MVGNLQHVFLEMGLTHVKKTIFPEVFLALWFVCKILGKTRVPSRG